MENTGNNHASQPLSGEDNSSGRVTPYVIFAGLIAACSGLVFGYNIGVSGGVTSMDSFLDLFFPSVTTRSEEAHQDNYCKFNDQGLQAFTSCLFLAGLVSTFLASHVTKSRGRRVTMITAGLLSLAGTALTAGAKHIIMLIVGRILLGFGTGFANQAAPIYLCEIAPLNLRGTLNAMFQMNVTIGIFCANMVNYAVDKYVSPSLRWRVAIAGTVVPALILTVGTALLSDSPISLIERGKLEEGRKSLQRARGTKHVDAEFMGLVKASEEAQDLSLKQGMAQLFGQNKPQLFIATLCAIFQQLTGINAIMFYAPVLFQTLGFKNNASLYSAAIIGAVNMGSTVASMVLVDRVGRKVLLVQGGIQMLICQVAIGIILGTQLRDPSSTGGGPLLPHTAAITIVSLICIFVAGFGWSWGPLTWLICGEIFPLETRSTGQSIAVFGNLLATFAVAQAFLSMLCAMRFGIFLFFAGWVALMTAFVILLVPETKGVQLELIQNLINNHWFWRAFNSKSGQDIQMYSQKARDLENSA